MKLRVLAACSLVGLVGVSPALPAAAKPKPKPKPIHGSFTAQATPDPTSDMPGGSAKCNPKTPSARATKAFTVPAAGTLTVQLNNKLDWSGDIRDKDGVVTDSDGQTPNAPEVMETSFKRKTAVTIGACNFSGEPSITVTYTFTYK